MMPLLLIGSLSISPDLWAQEVEHTQRADLLVRLLYENSIGAGTQQVCIAVSSDGEYRLLRWMQNTAIMRVEGKMPQDQLRELTNLLGASDFWSVGGDHGVGIIRQGAESFAAEIPPGTQLLTDEMRKLIEPKAKLVRWLNADGESPFPAPIAKVAGWLQHFQPTQAKPFEYAEFPDVCPVGGLRFVQPTVAVNTQPQK